MSLGAAQQVGDSPATPPEDAAEPQGPSNRVLVVDDEDVIRNVLAHRLEQEDGLVASTAADAQSALDFLHENEVDAVLTDIRMPGMDGLELLRRIKAHWPETAVIIMSGYADMSNTIEALRMGAVDFFQKPFELVKVTESLARIFRAKRLEDTKKQALAFLEEESRVFSIPNDLDLCPIVTNEVTKNLADKGITDVSFLESIRVALNEMLFNAIEHGNLNITYQAKSQVMEGQSDYSSFVRERAKEPELADRRVKLEYFMDSGHVRFVITDQGNGFDHSKLPDPTDPENLLSGHGRGILMTQIYMDELIFNEKGNQVTLIKRKKQDSRISPARPSHTPP